MKTFGYSKEKLYLCTRFMPQRLEKVSYEMAPPRGQTRYKQINKQCTQS